GGDHLMSVTTARRLRAALEAVVQRGTAAGIKQTFAGSEWRIGGKTGTGPGDCGQRCGGWFASLVSDRRGGRYVVLGVIEGKGAGGGVSAQTAAAVARNLVAARGNAQH